MEDKRYFIVCFNGTVKAKKTKEELPISETQTLTGHLEVITDNGCYVNKKEFFEIVKQDIKNLKKGELVSLSISNIIELNEKDYKDWQATEDYAG